MYRCRAALTIHQPFRFHKPTFRKKRKMKSLDDRILIYIQDHIRNPVLDPVMIAITNLGNGLWFVIGVYLWFSGENIPGGRYILISLLVSWILSKIFKVIFGRTRAYHAISGLTTIVPELRSPVSLSGNFRSCLDSFCGTHQFFENVRGCALPDGSSGRRSDRSNRCGDLSIDTIERAL